MSVSALLLDTKFKSSYNTVKGLIRPSASILFEIKPTLPAYALLITKIAYGAMESGTLTERFTCEPLLGALNILTRDRIWNPVELVIPVTMASPLICQYSNLTSYEQTLEVSFEYVRCESEADLAELKKLVKAGQL